MMAVVAPHPDGKQHVIDTLRKFANEIEVGTVEPISMSQQADTVSISGLDWQESRYTGYQSLQLDYRWPRVAPVPKVSQDSAPVQPSTHLTNCLTLLTAYRDRCAELVAMGMRGFPDVTEVTDLIKQLKEESES